MQDGKVGVLGHVPCPACVCVVVGVEGDHAEGTEEHVRGLSSEHLRGMVRPSFRQREEWLGPGSEEGWTLGTVECGGT